MVVVNRIHHLLSWIKSLLSRKIGPETARKINWRRITYIVVTVVCLWALILLIKPERYGDGFEYLGMTVSIAQHGTPELRDADVSARRLLVTQNPNIDWIQPDSKDHTGYYTARNGKEYCFHFWLYSGLNAVSYFIIKVLRGNPLNSFLATNLFLMVFLFLWIAYRGKYQPRTRNWLLVFSVLTPALLYLPWSHPEVFIYVFLFLGLLELTNGFLPLGTLFIAISATQASPLTVISLAALGYLLWQFKSKRLPLNPLTVSLSLGSILFLILPYAFYWINFGTPSLIAGGSGSFANLQFITFPKIISLFLDLNFGMIVYVPLLLFAIVFLVVKRKPAAIIGCLALVVTAVICTTQENWNCGMEYIHRYAIWLLPILIMSSLAYFTQMKLKSFNIHLAILFVTTGIITFTCLAKHEDGNYLKIGPLTNVVLAVSPSLYNPPPDVFAERVLGGEINYLERLPIAVTAPDGTLRKRLALDSSSNKLVYSNGPLRITTDFSLLRMQNAVDDKDIVQGVDGLISFGPGWYTLEDYSQGIKWRWMSESSKFYFEAGSEATLAQIQITVASFGIPRTCAIYVNGKHCFERAVGTSSEQIQFKSAIKAGLNRIDIGSLEGAIIPSDIPQLHSSDSRSLSFRIASIRISP
jgi:hypothetical protein